MATMQAQRERAREPIDTAKTPFSPYLMDLMDGQAYLSTCSTANPQNQTL